MSHAQAAAPVAPIPPSIASLSIPERMVEVMRRLRMQGQPTTISDFLAAEETCDLSEAELCANIGAAKRMIHPEVVRHDRPPTPVMPWDFDRSYRRERVARAAAIVADLPASFGDADMFSVLRQAFSARELGDLWPEIIAAAAALVAQRRVGVA